jgi:FtsP/CotA-like multicopper oxidase with cupredoxin domain
MKGVADSERFTTGEVVEWEFDNTSSMMMMAHPMHIHGPQFHVVKRDASNVSTSVLDSLRDGFVDGGLKDTVLVLPGEHVRVRQRITEYPGLYLYHCHNLEHEDLGMMRNYCVEAST